MNKMPFINQAYLCLIPAVPLGYLIVHGFRDDSIWTRLYVNRSILPPTDSLKHLIETEMDQVEGIRHPDKIISLTNELEPKIYGGFFLTKGPELQFPIRMAIDDVEQARRLGSSLEMDLGLAKYRRKVETNSLVGDELVSRLMLSDHAKRFIIQRQLQLANSGVFFCTPIATWVGISAASYFVFKAMIPVFGSVGAFVCVSSLLAMIYLKFLQKFHAHWTKKADESVIELGNEYLCGARDYFNSGMKFNRLMRKILGEEGEKNIDKNGDLKTDSIPYSQRLKNVEACAKAKNISLTTECA